MARIYLSPSTQDTNDYKGGSDEETQMRRVCFPAADLLRSAGHIVRVGGTVSARSNALDANAWGCDWYVAVHSNSGGGHGTETWCFPGSAKSRQLAEALQKRVAAASNEPDRGVKESSGYIELNTPDAPSAIVELVFHDCAAEAEEVRSNPLEFAQAVTLALLDVAGGALPADDDEQVFFGGLIRRVKLEALGWERDAHVFGIAHDAAPVRNVSDMTETPEQKRSLAIRAAAAGAKVIDAK